MRGAAALLPLALAALFQPVSLGQPAPAVAAPRVPLPRPGLSMPPGDARGRKSTLFLKPSPNEVT